MLPDLRAAIAAIVVSVGLLVAGFGVAATFRVAQQNRPSPLQAARSALLTEPALRVEDLAPVVSRDDSAPANADHPDETASIAPSVAPPPPTVAEPAPVVAAAPIVADPVVVAAPAAPPPVFAPAPQVATAPAPQVIAVLAPQVVAAPETPSDTPEPTGSVAAVAHADAPVAAVPAPAAEPPVGGPMEQAALTPTETPEAATPVVKKKPRIAIRKALADRKKARARSAAKRAAARRAAAPQNSFQQNSWQQNSWQPNRQTQPSTGFENR
jgi:hypothetical protein